MQFKYKAVTSTGQTIEGIHDGESEHDVISMLKGNNYMPISIEQTADSGQSTAISFGKVKKKDLAVFCRQFYTMLNSGVTIIKCLDILERQTENKHMRTAIADVFENVQKGMTLSEAMKAIPKVFPPILIHMVEAGEASGSLDTIMDRMAVHYEKEFKIENKVKGAMVYPAVLAVVATGVVVFLMIFVMPTFVSMFEGSGVELPGPTKALLAISHSLRAQWYIYIAAVIALVFLFKYIGSTTGGRMLYDTIKLKIPVFKNVSIKIATSRFTRTLSTLLYSGIPLMQGLDIVSKIVDNKNIALRLDNAREEVRKGVPLSKTIKDAVVFPPMVDSMIRIGEESGDLDGILNKSADFYDEEVEVALSKMTEMMQPIMIVIMALIVGFIVIAIALPMFDMASTI